MVPMCNVLCISELPRPGYKPEVGTVVVVSTRTPRRLVEVTRPLQRLRGGDEMRREVRE